MPAARVQAIVKGGEDRVRRALAFVVAVLLGTSACGRAPSSPSAGGGADRPSTAREVQGQLTLPQGTSIAPRDLRVVTAWGEGTVTQTSPTTGTFTAVVVTGAAQLVSALDNNRRIVLAGTSGVTDALALTSETTAESLVLMNPVVATGEREVVQRLRQHLANHRGVYLDPVRTAVEQQLQSLGHIDPRQDPLRNALLNAWNRLYQDIRAGALAQVSGRSAAAPQTEPKSPRVRRSALSPDQDQSGVKLTEGEDADNRESTYELLLANYWRRWVGVHARPFDGNGNPLGPWGYYGLTSARAGVSLGSVVTGAVFGPSVKGYVLNLPEGTSRVDIEVWGAGFNRPSSQPRSDVEMTKKVDPVLADFFFELILPAIGYVLGIPGNLKAIDPQALGDLEAAVLEVAQGVVALVGGDLRDYAETGTWAPTSSIAAVDGLVSFMLDSPAGVRLLELLIREIVTEGWLHVSLRALKAALEKVSPWLLLISTAELVTNYTTVVWAWSQARGVEFWTATLPRSPGWYFVATLNWDQPTDLDLYTTAPNGEVSYWANKVISVGELDYDDTDGYGPENFTLRRKLVGRYRIDVDFYRYSDQTSGHTMASSYRVVITARNGRQYDCRRGVINAPGDRHVACFVDVDDAGRVTVTPATNAAGVAPSGVGRDRVKPTRR